MEAPEPSCGPGSSIGIATEYGLDGPGIESRWGRDFPPVQTGPGAHPASCTMGTGSFPGVKSGRGVLLTTHPLLVPRSWKSSYTSTPLWAITGPVTGLLYLARAFLRSRSWYLHPLRGRYMYPYFHMFGELCCLIHHSGA